MRALQIGGVRGTMKTLYTDFASLSFDHAQPHPQLRHHEGGASQTTSEHQGVERTFEKGEADNEEQPHT